MGLFEHYSATPGSIYAASDQAATAGDQCRQLGTSVDGRGQVACTSVTGDLDAPLFAAPQPVVSSSQALDGSSLIVHGCLNLWGDMVTTYNGEIDALNQEWASAQGNSFGVDSSTYMGPHCGTESPDGGQGAFDDAVADASAALRADLVRRKGLLDDELDSGAGEVAGVLDQGPTAEAALTLFQSGALPAAAADIAGEIWKKFAGTFYPSDQSAYGWSTWGTARGIQAFGIGSKYMKQGSLGRFAPRGPDGRFLPINGTSSWVNAWRRGQGSNYVANPGNAAAYAKWSTASKWVGRAGTVLTVGTSAFSQWQQDANDPSLSTAERVGRAGTAGAITGAGAWAGAAGGAQLGAMVGSFGGPVGTVIGGAVGGLIGGAIGAGVGDWVSDHVVEYGGEAVEGIVNGAEAAWDAGGELVEDAGDLVEGAGEALGDAGEAVGDFFGF